MFNDIGKKLKMLAKVVFGIGVCVSVIIGITLMATAASHRDDEFLSAVGVIVLLTGWIVPWIGSSFVYGFGELIDKTCDIAASTAPQANQNASADEQAQTASGAGDFLDKLKEQGLISEDDYRAVLDNRKE